MKSHGLNQQHLNAILKECAMCSVPCALCSGLCVQCSWLCALCSELCARCSLLYVRCSMLPALCPVLFSLWSVFSALCSVLFALCSVFSAQFRRTDKASYRVACLQLKIKAGAFSQPQLFREPAFQIRAWDHAFHPLSPKGTIFQPEKRGSTWGNAAPRVIKLRRLSYWNSLFFKIRPIWGWFCFENCIIIFFFILIFYPFGVP